MSRSITLMSQPMARIATLAIAAIVGFTGGASADQSAAPARPVCLDVNRIDHTEVLNDHQILFYMNGKEVWINNLASRCHSLTREDGWAWSSSVPRYCDNLESIRVLRTGETCLLGAFSRYERPKRPS